MLTPLMELRMDGFPTVFTTKQLEYAAQSMCNQLGLLIDVEVLLQHTTVTHSFRLDADEKQRPTLMLVIGLTLKNQRILDFQFRTVTLGTLEQLALEDRQRMVNACRNLPTQTTLAAIGLSQRIASACLNIPAEDVQPGLSSRLGTLLGVKRRHWHGSLTDHPWQHTLPALAKYEWRSELLTVRVQLHREKRGFSLTLMRPDSRPKLLQNINSLRMPERPLDVEIASVLDRAEFTASPVDIVIRVGSRPGSDRLVVADFVDFKRTTE